MSKSKIHVLHNPNLMKPVLKKRKKKINKITLKIIIDEYFSAVGYKIFILGRQNCDFGV